MLSKFLFLSNLHCVCFKQDTAGQERFHALGPIYYRDSNGAILVYDITDEDSFQKVLLCLLISLEKLSDLLSEFFFFFFFFIAWNL